MIPISPAPGARPWRQAGGGIAPLPKVDRNRACGTTIPVSRVADMGAAAQ